MYRLSWMSQANPKSGQQLLDAQDSPFLEQVDFTGRWTSNLKDYIVLPLLYGFEKMLFLLIEKNWVKLLLMMSRCSP